MNWPDSSTAEFLIADGRHASALDRPESPNELREGILQRVAQGYAVYPRGGGTAMHVGGLPRAPGVLLDTTGMARVVDYPAADMTITVEAGITLNALQAILAQHGQRLPLEAPDPDRATLGGIYATNTCGLRRFGNGRPRDQIIGIAFATSQGVIVHGGGRVVKNVAGYDFPKLLTGSFGTLGAICQITLKVRPAPEASALTLTPFPTLERLQAALEALNTSATRPVALDALNAPAARLALGSAAPEAPWTLAVGYEDTRPAISWQVDRLREELGDVGAGMMAVIGDDADPLWMGLTAFQAAAPGPITLRASLRPSLVPDLLATLDPERWAVQVHAGNGVIHAQGLGDDPPEAWATRVQRLRDATERAGGHVVVTRCPTEWKDRLHVWGSPRPDWVLSARVKQALDPGGVMNPGRFIGTI